MPTNKWNNSSKTKSKKVKTIELGEVSMNKEAKTSELAS
jgi:hypothetical protein